MDSKKEPKEGYDKFTVPAILTVIGCILMMIMVGYAFNWGNISAYCTGYYRLIGNDVTTYDMYIVYPFIIFFSTVVFPYGMYFSSTYGVKLYNILN